MTIASSGIMNHRQRPVFKDRLAFFQRTTPQFATNRVEQVLIFATVALLPLEITIPQIAGFGIMFLVFAVLGGYVISKRPECLAKIWRHPLLLAAYVFLGYGYLSEFSHSNSNYYEIFRIALNFGGSVFLACLCRDRKALRSAMYGYLIVGVYTSYFLFGSYGALSGATALDYGEGDRLRSAVFEENALDANLNNLAFFAAQGAGVALALALTARSNWSRYLFLGVALACCVGSFLPMSRGGVVILCGVCASGMLAYGVNRSRTLVIAILFGATMLILVPPAVLSRLTFSTEVDEHGRMEGRAGVYTAFFHHLPEFVMTGVGAGNFWGPWGSQSRYANSRGKAIGAHNVFFQITIYWGLPAVFALLAIIWQAYSCLPGRYGDDGLAIAVLVIAISLLLWSLQVHNFYDKAFAIGIGLLVGAQQWIWPKRVSPQARSRRGFRASLRRSS